MRSLFAAWRDAVNFLFLECCRWLSDPLDAYPLIACEQQEQVVLLSILHLREFSYCHFFIFIYWHRRFGCLHLVYRFSFLIHIFCLFLFSLSCSHLFPFYLHAILREDLLRREERREKRKRWEKEVGGGGQGKSRDKTLRGDNPHLDTSLLEGGDSGETIRYSDCLRLGTLLWYDVHRRDHHLKWECIRKNPRYRYTLF